MVKTKRVRATIRHRLRMAEMIAPGGGPAAALRELSSRPRRERPQGLARRFRRSIDAGSALAAAPASQAGRALSWPGVRHRRPGADLHPGARPAHLRAE